MHKYIYQFFVYYTGGGGRLKSFVRKVCKKTIPISFFNTISIDLNTKFAPFFLQACDAGLMEVFRMLVKPGFSSVRELPIILGALTLQVGLQVLKHIIMWGLFWAVRRVVGLLETTGMNSILCNTGLVDRSSLNAGTHLWSTFPVVFP